MFAKTFLATLAAATLLGFAATAAPVAAVSSDTISQTVFVGDLNLASKAGARIALSRIDAAANTICGDRPDERRLDRSTLYHACIRTAVDQAVSSLGSPMVTALHTPQGVAVLANR